MEEEINNSINNKWTPLFNGDIKFRVQTKQLRTKGNLVYEYNPFRNYRLDEDLFEYQGYYYNLIELYKDFGITLKCFIKEENDRFNIELGNLEGYKPPEGYKPYEEVIVNLNNSFKYQNFLKALHESKIDTWEGVPDNQTDPVLREKGELVDFTTNLLEFSINHPASVLPQPSYDGSVNLIINDGNSYPKLINSRFSSTGKNTYEIVDRKGNSDTNIYDRGKEFVSDTSLYKIVNTFPELKLVNIQLGGNLKIGNYHFYFRLSDADGNESDFIEESGLISIFKGINKYSSISTGERDENSYKQILFQLTNLDTSFTYVTVYYSRHSAEINLNYTTEYAKVDRKYLISHNGVSSVIVTGFEDTIALTSDDINLTYSLVDNCQAHAICLNRLFLANVQKPDIPYELLLECSLRFFPTLQETYYDVDLDENYTIKSTNKGYIDPLFIYDKTGYWNKELYRFGIVYIMKNGELSPVFNIRGGINLKRLEDYEEESLDKIFSQYNLYKNGEIYYIEYDEETNLITGSDDKKNVILYENIKGVISFDPPHDTNTIYSLQITTNDEVINELLKYVKGFFFVRLKRIPSILAQGITIGIDKLSRTPTIPTIYDENNINELNKTYINTENINEINYISEGFLSRYKFYYKKKKTNWSLGKILAISAAVVGLAAATVFTCGAAGIAGGALAGLFAEGAVATAAISALGGGVLGTVILGTCVTAAGLTAGVIAGGVVGGIGEGIANITYNIQRVGAKKSYNGRQTVIPDGYTLAEDDSSRQLVLDFKDRVILKDPTENDVLGILCPEYEVNPSYFNPIFSGNNHLITSTLTQGVNNLVHEDSSNRNNFFSNFNRHFYIPLYYDDDKTKNSGEFTIIPVEDNKKTSAIGEILYRARAGEAEEVWRIESISNHHLKDISNEYDEVNNEGRKINSDIIRGSFGTYLAFNNPGTFRSAETVNIYAPGYKESSISEYIQVRMLDHSPFMAISYRTDINNLQKYSNKQSVLVNDDTSALYTFNLFRGDCYLCLFTHRVNRNFNDPSSPYNDLIVDPNTWKNNYDPAKTESFEEINLGDVNAVQLGMWTTFRVRSNYNLNVLTLDQSNVDEKSMCGHDRGRFPQIPMSVDGTYKIKESNVYNRAFATSLSERYNFEVPDVPYLKNWFGTRIMYSDLFIADSFKNGFRQFWTTNYRDYSREYGQIIKLLEFRGSLICVFEHGIALIPVNERTVSGEGAGGPVYINTQNVLPENPKIISDTFGSQWAESIIKTPTAIYGVDTIGKKIWRTNGSNFECISDFHVQEFLNNNISLTERELTPIIGIRNVKTHYNKFKGDVMFTFYDNLQGFEEKVWNLCYNELLQKWITFYSWIPSYSENIYNQYFSFDRNTSKWISKLGISNANSLFKDGIVLDKNIIPNNLTVKENSNLEKKPENYLFDEKTNKYCPKIAKLSLENRELPDWATVNITYELERDNYGNYKNFRIIEQDNDSYLCLVTDSVKLCTEKYLRSYINEKGETVEITSLKDDLEAWEYAVVNNIETKYIKNDKSVRKSITLRDKEPQTVILLNIKANISFDINSDEEKELKQALIDGFNKLMNIDSSSYSSVVALIPEYNLLFLTTDFWKHGQAGIIDIADEIVPTLWYGKQHPFEFEFVVAEDPINHKIFNNLEIISNKAAPESFHYEIVGECYDFAQDKKNMYIRQEATKELYLYNGSDIVFNSDYKKLEEKAELIEDNIYKKSTIFPLYYRRDDTINEVEDSYHLFKEDEIGKSDKNFSALAGAEIVRYKNLDEYRIWNHAKAVDITKDSRLRGNMQYKEDIWNVQINPINLVQKNETTDDWDEKFRTSDNKDEKQLVPAELNLFKDDSEIPKFRKDEGRLELPDDWTRNVVSWNDYENLNKEVKLKDKFMKVRIRYSGNDLAIISAINTLYTISFS